MSKYIICFLLILSTSLSWGQEEERQRKLEEQKERLQEEIRAQEKLLQSQKTKEKSVVKVVVQQTAKINLQQKLINTTAKQAKVLGNSMYINQVSVNKLNKDLKILKEDYAKMIVKSYKSRSEQSKAMFLLSSENFLQAYKRAQYMKQYSSFRKLQGEEIKVKTIELERYNNKLSTQKQEKVKLIVESEKEKQVLEKDKKEQQKLLTVMSQLDKDKTMSILDELIDKMKDKKLSDNINLELEEAVAATGSETLKTKLASINTGKSMLDAYKEALYGGSRMEGRNIFNYNSTAQCVRCHSVGAEGGSVGPLLTHIAGTLTREQILESLVDPSARIAPGFGSVSLKLKGGQEVIGVLIKEADGELTLKTSEAEPLVIPIARIEKRQNLPSSMPPMGELLSKREIRDIVEFMGGLK